MNSVRSGFFQSLAISFGFFMTDDSSSSSVETGMPVIVVNRETGRIAPMATNEPKQAMLATINRTVNDLYFIEFAFSEMLLELLWTAIPSGSSALLMASQSLA